MIAEHLIPRLRERFPDRDIAVATGGARLAVFPPVHPEVGPLEIYEEPGRVVVVIGRFTHAHFMNYGSGELSHERCARVANDVLRFIEDVLADRIEFYGSGRGGGWRPRVGKPRGTVSRLLYGRRTYVWSGPLATAARR